MDTRHLIAENTDVIGLFTFQLLDHNVSTEWHPISPFESPRPINPVSLQFIVCPGWENVQCRQYRKNRYLPLVK